MGTRRAVLAGLGLGVVFAGVRVLAPVPQPGARRGPAPAGGFDAGLPVQQLFAAAGRVPPSPVPGELLDGPISDRCCATWPPKTATPLARRASQPAPCGPLLPECAMAGYRHHQSSPKLLRSMGGCGWFTAGKGAADAE